jgi:membrane protein implicated in regulation of membrane protease activity
MAEGDPFLKRYGPILGFIVLAAIIAAGINAIGAAFGISPEWRLAGFAVWVVLQAFAFGHTKAQLDGNRADPVYYLLGALGIVLLFFDAGTERLRISLAGDYAIATANRDLFQQKRPELERVLGDVEPLLKKFREAARSPETAARRERALKDCEALQAEEAKRNIQRQFEEMQRRIQSVPLSPGAPSPYRVPRLDVGLMPPVNCRELVASDPDLEQLANVENSRDLVDIIRRQSAADLKTELGLDLGALTMEDVATFLHQALEGGSISAALDAEQRRLESDVSAVRGRFEKLTPSIESGPRRLAWLRQFLWPYVLVCAVGLKLSRKPYLMI